MPSQEVLEIPLMMFVVFAAAKLLAEVFERLGQPGIVGEIVAGALVGPAVVGLVHPNEVLTALSDLGVMFLLFGVGLETKPQNLLKLAGVATLVAVAGVVLPFAMGWGLLAWWGEPSIEAIFVGAAMVATSVGITAQVLAAKGVLQERASQIILAAAVIDDVLGLLVLAVVSSMAKGEVKVMEIALTAFLAIGFVVLIVTMGDRAVSKVVPRMQESMRVADAEFTLALALLFGLSALAVYVHIAAIVGAFFAGMALSNTVGPRVHDLSRGASELLVPFFLAGIGLHMDLSVFSNRSTLLLAVLVTIAACASKFFGCALSSWRLGRSDAVKIGIGMIPRGEVGMVVAQLGLTLGVIPQNIYGVVVFMAVATTLIAPPLLKIVFTDGSKTA